MKTTEEDDELRERLRGYRVNGSADGDPDNDYMTNTGINNDPPLDEDFDEDGEEQGILDDDDLLDDEETETEKNELDGPANDLVAQPGYDDEDDDE